VRTLLNQVELPIAVLRRDGFIVENANDAYFELLGGRDVLGKPFAEPVSDASWRFVFAPVKNEGHVRNRHVVAIGVEVTENVRARQQRDDVAAAAIRANKTKDEFLAALGHELRNPLSPILTGLQLMRVKGLRSHELDVVERQVSVLTRLVDDLLDVSRIGRTQVDLRNERVEMSDLVARARETVDPLLNERGQRVALCVSGPGLRVNVDPARMTQVLANLLTNAAKYSERGSEITVRSERHEQWVRVSIEDRGIGIAPEMLPHVFEPFAQERSAVRRSRGGLGLGLAIVRNLVEAHGGRVVVHSDGPGSGSTFSVELPAADDDLARSGGAAQERTT
jgi:signal transduction histidine kinase